MTLLMSGKSSTIQNESFFGGVFSSPGIPTRNQTGMEVRYLGEHVQVFPNKHPSEKKKAKFWPGSEPEPSCCLTGSEARDKVPTSTNITAVGKDSKKIHFQDLLGLLDLPMPSDKVAVGNILLGANHISSPTV